MKTEKQNIKPFNYINTLMPESRHGHFFRTLKIRANEQRFTTLADKLMRDCGEAMRLAHLGTQITIDKSNYAQYFDTNAKWMTNNTNNPFHENFTSIVHEIAEFINFAREYYDLNIRIESKPFGGDIEKIGLFVSWNHQNLNDEKTYQISVKG